MAFTYKKQFGQHFLRQVPKELLFPLDELEKLQSLQKTAVIGIVEIGPGSGNVTEAVLQQLLPFSHLRISYTAVDVDLEAIQTTKTRVEALNLPQRISFSLEHIDVLKYFPEFFRKQEFCYIFGSLPYNISKKIVKWNCQIYQKISQEVITLPSRFVIQKEVADDYISHPPTAAFLGTELSLYATTRRITRNLPPGAFYPPPKVDSAILEIAWKDRKSMVKDAECDTALAKVIRAGFTAKRKVIASVFKKDLHSNAPDTIAHLLHLRAHELSLNEWKLLAENLIT